MLLTALSRGSKSIPVPPDIKVAFFGDEPSIQYSAGVRRAWDPSRGDPPGLYSLEAWLPDGPWQDFNPCAEEVTGESDQSTTVLITPPLPRLLRISESIGVSALRTLEATRIFNESPAHADLLASIVAEISVYVQSVDAVRSLGVRIGEPLGVTTTWDYDAKLMVGLHVDDWDRLDLAQRGKARNRVCVNLGEELRHFIFASHSIAQVVSYSNDHHAFRRALDPVEQLFHTDCTTPIYRVALRPGQAYVAPTENLIHDGSTATTSSVDRCFTAIGRFVVC